ncbi:peptide ligase PGM1-related protein [Streptomyces sp. NPDC060028]|uniref:peptide ligase PGM1-related protein n=1 Tax=Streptomyces sp. NPDC060028 TaxID=3347041 RepID=UPI0036A7ECD7
MTSGARRWPAQVSIESRESDPRLLERRAGATLFPERLLGAAIVNTVCRSAGRLLYVTAVPVIDARQQVDYYLGLLGDQVLEQREAVQLVSVGDGSCRWLSEKVLDPADPAAARVRARIVEFLDRGRRDGADVRLSYFEPSFAMQQFARALGVTPSQADAAQIPLGTKHAGRLLFAEAGIEVPLGTRLCRSTEHLAKEIGGLVRAGRLSVLIKLDSTAYAGAFGHALLDLNGIGTDRLGGTGTLVDRIRAALPRSTLFDAHTTWENFAREIEESGAIAEEWIGAGAAHSPSFQGRLTSDGTAQTVSTHDQVFDPGRRTFTGCLFPADAAYRHTVIDYGLRIGQALLKRGLRAGDYGVDFLATPTSTGWRLLGCEVNLRATATKHAFSMAAGLLGITTTPDGRLISDAGERAYESTDSITSPHYAGLRPVQLTRAVTDSPLHYDPVRKTGVILHMMSALVEHGKFGAVCIGTDRVHARALLRDLHSLVDTLVPVPGHAGQAGETGR